MGIYFLWSKNLFFASISIFGLSIFGAILVWRKDIHELAKTALGKWMPGQAQPMNLVIRVVGAFLLAYGIWTHSILYILPGVSIIILARYFGTKPI